MTFFMALAVTTIGVGMIAGAGYWIIAGIKKTNLNFWLKYKLFRIKPNGDHKLLLDELKDKESEEIAEILLVNGWPKQKVSDLIYVRNMGERR